MSATGDVGLGVSAVGEIDLGARNEAAEFVEDGECGGLGGDHARGEDNLGGLGGLGAGDLRRDGKNREEYGGDYADAVRTADPSPAERRPQSG